MLGVLQVMLTIAIASNSNRASNFPPTSSPLSRSPVVSPAMPAPSRSLPLLPVALSVFFVCVSSHDPGSRCLPTCYTTSMSASDLPIYLPTSPTQPTPQPKQIELPNLPVFTTPLSTFLPIIRPLNLKLLLMDGLYKNRRPRRLPHPKQSALRRRARPPRLRRPRRRFPSPRHQAPQACAHDAQRHCCFWAVYLW
ncbi:hypothetical protein B0T13DRAFT_310315 [Neurospora crassa]|nr:hypothetical protein B0T13DRAFT_310315 [Neurospora crassa]